MTQSQALEILKTGVNVFLTGEPGSGKTHTISQFIKYLREHGVEPAITASTGIAATHIGGMTIHSWSGIGIKEDLTQADLNKFTADSKSGKKILKTSVLVIDEVSMLSQRTLSMVDLVCRTVRRVSEPFGGMQVVFVGDFFQLPPVTKYGTLEGNQKQFAYNSPAWVRANPTVCYLTEQHRQDDRAFLEVLTAIRSNEMEEGLFEHIQSRMAERSKVPIQIPRLFTKNVSVYQLNHDRLLRLPGKEYVYTMKQSGRGPLIEALKKGCLSPEQLYLKVGAIVMFTKNSPQFGYSNGTLGMVKDFNPEGLPYVEIRGGRKVLVNPVDWKVEQSGQIMATINQLPLRLAWAITIHKSQGMSMDAAAMDLSDVFEYGQGYVALSRVRRLSGLHLFGINRRAFEVHPDILVEDKVFRTASKIAQKDFSSRSKEEVKQIQNDYLLSIGGTLEAQEIPEARVKEKVNTTLETFTLWNSGKTLDQICEARKLKPSTIITHLETLLEEGHLKSADMMRLLSADLFKALPEIHELFDELSDQKLTPIFVRLKGKYSFEQLKIARMVRKKQKK
jgi:ATP-dependent DNA helicase PIF1